MLSTENNEKIEAVTVKLKTRYKKNFFIPAAFPSVTLADKREVCGYCYRHSGNTIAINLHDRFCPYCKQKIYWRIYKLKSEDKMRRKIRRIKLNGQQAVS